MCGVITTRHLFLHALTIVSEFGPRTYLRCLSKSLFSHKPVTFLEMVSASGACHPLSP